MKKRIFFYSVAYGLLCEGISLFFFGFNIDVPIGLIGGIAATTINFILLEKVIDGAITGNKRTFAFLFQLGRILIYGSLAYGCYMLSVRSLIAYGISVLGLVVAIMITYGKEGGENDRF
ncbi:uncharacterized membrane protein YjjP (DUF1212 family) [Clostridiales Family XIII bacterium PM5-7]